MPRKFVSTKKNNPDEFIEQDTPENMYKKAGLDAKAKLLVFYN